VAATFIPASLTAGEGRQQEVQDMKRQLFLSMAALALFASAAIAQMAAPPAPEFAQKAAMSDMFEIESSKLAVEKSEDADVKAFAQQMITDHSKASEELMATLQQAGSDMAVPAMLDGPHRDKLEKLTSAAGSDFDAEYVSMQVAGHDEAVALFTAFSEQGDNDALKAFAQKTLPTLKMHQQHVHELKQKQSS
jgi:putative membrane protein